MLLYGNDLSSCQSTLTGSQFQALKSAGCDFLIARCGAGNDGKDPCFEGFRAGARLAGIPFGAYHFCYPFHDVAGIANRSPEDQAELWWREAGGVTIPGELTHFLDFEYPRPEAWGKPLLRVNGSEMPGTNVDAAFVADWLVRAWRRLSTLQGRAAGIYGDPWMLTSAKLPAELAAAPLWGAWYGAAPKPVFPWAGWSAWQTAGGTKGTLPNGIPVDTDVIADDATLAMLRGLPLS